MSETVIRHVRGKDLPDKWAKQVKGDLNTTFTLVIKTESANDVSEDVITSEGILQALEDIKSGQVKSLNPPGRELTQKDLDEKLWS